MERLLSVAFVAEFAFRGPHTDDRTTRELVDILIAHGDVARMISQKRQEDPRQLNDATALASGSFSGVIYAMGY